MRVDQPRHERRGRRNRWSGRPRAPPACRCRYDLIRLPSTSRWRPSRSVADLPSKRRTVGEQEGRSCAAGAAGPGAKRQAERGHGGRHADDEAAPRKIRVDPAGQGLDFRAVAKADGASSTSVSSVSELQLYKIGFQEHRATQCRRPPVAAMISAAVGKNGDAVRPVHGLDLHPADDALRIDEDGRRVAWGGRPASRRRLRSSQSRPWH